MTEIVSEMLQNGTNLTKQQPTKSCRRTKTYFWVAAICTAFSLLLVATALIWVATSQNAFDDNDVHNESLMTYSAPASDDSLIPAMLPTDGFAESDAESDKNVDSPPLYGRRQTTTPLVHHHEQQKNASEMTSEKKTISSRESTRLTEPVCNLSPLLDSAQCVKGYFDASNKEHWMSPLADFTTLIEWFRPIEYKLNFSIEEIGDDYPLVGSEDLLMEVRKESNVIVLHSSMYIRFIDSAQISVWSCDKGKFICVQSITRLLDRECLIIELSSSMEAGSFVRLRINRFESELSSKNDGIVVRIPSKWEQNRPLMIATQFSARNAKTSAVFPSIARTKERTTFRLCLTRPKELTARSNMEVSSELRPSWSENRNGLLMTCFQPTPPIPPEQFGFVLLSNMKSLQAQIPASTTTELFIGKHLNTNDYKWALEKTARSMQLMAEMTTFEYPLSTLTILSSAIDTTDAINSLGLIQIRERWIEYPKFVQTHRLLVGQIIQQWTSNIVTFCDICLQTGFSNYLEWIVSAKAGGHEGQSEEVLFAADFRQRLSEVRNKFLHTSQTLSSVTLLASKNKVLEDEEAMCSDRVSLVFYTIESTYGHSAVVNLITQLFRKYEWHTCVTDTDLSRLFEELPNLTDARLIFNHIMTAVKPSVVKIHLHNGTLVLAKELTIELNSEVNENEVIPVELVDDLGRKNKIILKTSQQSLEKVVSFVIAEPIPFARFIYNVENYMKLSKCIDQKANLSKVEQCSPTVHDLFKNALNDLCWALVENKIQAENSEEIVKWRALFNSLARNNIVAGECRCCMQRKEEVKASCRWTWRDKCSKISILN